MTRVNRWEGALVAVLFAVLLGVLLGSGDVVVLAVLPLLVVAFGYAASEPPPTVHVERGLSNDRPSPGEPVTVTLTVRNEGEEFQPDVRVRDSVPDGVTVVSGGPGFATALRPGESASHEYEALSPRGEHEFGKAVVERANFLRTHVVTDERRFDGENEYTCETLLDTFPFLDQTVDYVGWSPTNEGGSGVEFHSTREYRKGDPMSRVDWFGFARTGKLSTVEYRQERSVKVVFLIDNRQDAHARPRGQGPDSFDLILYAASRGIAASIDDGNRTGVATVSGEWVPLGVTESFKERTQRVVAEMDAYSTRSIEDESLADFLSERLPRNTQVVFCTASLDEPTVEFCRRLISIGHETTVLTPDMTTSLMGSETTYGTRVASLRRSSRINRLRATGLAVVDWSLDEPISVELERLSERWR